MRIGAYQILVDLGRGGMANLAIARTAEDASPVMLKTLRPPPTDKRVAMFLEEGRLGVLLHHENLVRTLEAGRHQDRYFIAMEYLDGQPLDRLLHRVRSGVPNARSMLLWILAESLIGLHYAHELRVDAQPLNLVHRDFTPENIFVTYEGRVKALDFGVAKAAGRLAQSTTTGEVKGKIRYMAHEQALGLRTDRRADIFSAGAILYELCSGHPLWQLTMKDREVFDDLVAGAYPSELATETPGMNAILRKSLARDASERYRTAHEMSADLRAEIERSEPIAPLQAVTAEALSALFADQRDRSANMIAAAAARAAR